jgi:hypothetical protein
VLFPVSELYLKNDRELSIIGTNVVGCPCRIICTTVRVTRSVTCVYKTVPYLRKLFAGFAPWRRDFEPRSSCVRFVVDNVALGKVFSKYFGFLRQFSFHRLLHTHHLTSGAGTIDQLVADVPMDSVSPHPQGSEKTTTCVYHLHVFGLTHRHLDTGVKYAYQHQLGNQLQFRYNLEKFLKSDTCY